MQKNGEKEILIEAVSRIYPDSSKSTIRSWIKHNRITVNGSVISKPSAEIAKSAQVLRLSKPKPKVGPLEILLEDEHLIVINKPSGLLSVDLDSNRRTSLRPNSAHAWLKSHYEHEKIYVIHRLDRETSGVMLFGRSEEAFFILKEALKKRDVKRIYRAVVEGALIGEGAWENYLVENDKTFQVHISTSERDAHREWAKTYWKMIDSSERYTLLECTLETGKKNQIRVQAAHRGYPVAGDEKYGATYSCNDVFTSRICLHARELLFSHPISGEPIRCSVPEPEFFSKLIRKKP